MTAALRSVDAFTGETLGAVPTTAPDDVAGVVAEAAVVQPYWAQLPLAERGDYLRRAAQAILDRAETIRDLIAREVGKPRTEAELTEVLPSVDLLHWLADAGPRVLAEERIAVPQLLLRAKRPRVAYEPLGAIAVIGPWATPWLVTLGQVASALMTGNAVVLKPASPACLVGEWIPRVLARAGVPEGLVRTVHGPGAGAALAVAPGVGKVFHTGSRATAREVGAACGSALRGAVLECGGHDPMLVLSDAEVGAAAAGAVWAAFSNAGQSHGTVKRAYVAAEVAERFLAEVTSRARRLRVGDPLRAETEVGPLAAPAQRESVAALVREAAAAGARLCCGGPVAVAGGRRSDAAFYAPTVLAGATADMRLMREPAPGPVLGVTVVESIDEALALANDPAPGLGASVWTGDRDQGERVAHELRAGMVWINDHRFTHGVGQCPWGGVDGSGLGRSHGRAGLLECVEVKLGVWSPTWARDPWWPPYDETLGRAARHAATMVHGRESDRPRALRAGARPLLRVARRLARDTVRT